MNLQSWAHVSTIVGSVLLSLQLFRSNREEQDAAATWWDGNPLQGGTTILIRKGLGFLGLFLLVTGFAINLSLSVNQTDLRERGQGWFILAVVVCAVLLVWAGYTVAGAAYAHRRQRHFANLATNALQGASSGKLNHVQLFNTLRSYVSEMPPRYGELFNRGLETRALNEVAKGNGEVTDADWLEAGVVVRLRAATTEEGFALLRYLAKSRR